jgi:hypothetical protein
MIKQYILLSLLVTLLTGYASKVQAQPKSGQPFWVVEGNVNRPRYNILKFYSYDAQLIRQKISRRKLDVRKGNCKKFMNKKLAHIVRNRNEGIGRLAVNH